MTVQQAAIVFLSCWLSTLLVVGSWLITLERKVAEYHRQELAQKYSDKEGFEIKVVHGDSIIPDGALFVEGACFDKWFYYIEEEI